MYSAKKTKQKSTTKGKKYQRCIAENKNEKQDITPGTTFIQQKKVSHSIKI
jgi:hypothetical protein